MPLPTEMPIVPLTTRADDDFLNDAEDDAVKRKVGHAGMNGHSNDHDKRERVLVVDDDRNFLELAERLFIRENYTPICSDAPQSALQIARTVKPSAIFLDILMPGFDGWDVLAALKSDPVTADIPVFMISILAERSKALAAGADGIVMKPFDAAKVKAALAALRSTRGRNRAANV
ncbi:response regulator [Devosia sp. J2-20]|nr:response regulator [Devosia sp. J2-20]WDQ99510.1 response regulator [Devosia sp. J2-20]